MGVKWLRDLFYQWATFVLRFFLDPFLCVCESAFHGGSRKKNNHIDMFKFSLEVLLVCHIKSCVISCQRCTYVFFWRIGVSCSHLGPFIRRFLTMAFSGLWLVWIFIFLSYMYWWNVSSETTIVNISFSYLCSAFNTALLKSYAIGFPFPVVEQQQVLLYITLNYKIPFRVVIGKYLYSWHKWPHFNKRCVIFVKPYPQNIFTNYQTDRFNNCG